MANIEVENLIRSHIQNLMENKGLLKVSVCASSVYLKGYSADFKMKKIENAIKAYAPSVAIDDVIFYLDATMMGSGKNGFIMTTENLIWDGGMLVGKGNISLAAGNVFSTRMGLLELNGKGWVSGANFKQDVFVQGMNELMEKIGSTNTVSSTSQPAVAQPETEQSPTKVESDQTETTANTSSINSSVMTEFVIAVFKHALENDGLINEEILAKSSFYVKGFAHSDFKMKKIENAISEYARAVKTTDEALVYYDSTVFGSGKEGFLITPETVFWKLGRNAGTSSWKDLKPFTVKGNANYDGKDWPIDGVSGEAFAAAMNAIGSGVKIFEDLSKGFQVLVRLNLGAVRSKNLNPDLFKSAVDFLNESSTNCSSAGMDSSGSSSDDIVESVYYFGTEENAQKFFASLQQSEGCQNGSYSVSEVKSVDMVWSQLGNLVGAMYVGRCFDLSTFINYMKFELKLDEHMAENASKFSYGTFTDPRDGEVYHTVKIGDFEWMVENLRYKTEGGFADDGKGSRVYDDDPDCEKRYGRLYTWAAAMNLPDKYNSIALSPDTQRTWSQGNFQGIAPEGWHIPYHAELALLMDYIAERSDNSTQSALSNPLLWVEDFGKDDFGFNLVPGGMYEDEYTFKDEAALLWTSNPSTALIVTDEKAIISSSCQRSSYLAIRCVRNISQDVFAKVEQRSKDLVAELEARRKAEEEAERKAREIAEHEKRMEVMDAQIEEAKNSQRLAQEAADRQAAADRSDMMHCKYCGGLVTHMRCSASPTGKHVRKKSLL